MERVSSSWRLTPAFMHLRVHADERRIRRRQFHPSQFKDPCSQPWIIFQGRERCSLPLVLSSSSSRPHALVHAGV